MKVLLQRVSQASVSVNGKSLAEISAGYLLLTGLGDGDDRSKLRAMAEKIANMRLFPNEAGRFDKSILDIGGAALVVPQFTLFADTSKGRRPEFFGALKPELARPLVDEFVVTLKEVGVGKVECGEFGAHMMVSLVNDGPVTITLEN